MYCHHYFLGGKYDLIKLYRQIIYQNDWKHHNQQFIKKKTKKIHECVLISAVGWYRLINFRSTHYFAKSAKIWQLVFRWIVHLFTIFSINCFKFKTQTKSPWTKIGAKFKRLENKQSLEISVNQWTINKTDVSFYGWHGENMK